MALEGLEIGTVLMGKARRIKRVVEAHRKSRQGQLMVGLRTIYTDGSRSKGLNWMAPGYIQKTNSVVPDDSVRPLPGDLQFGSSDPSDIRFRGWTVAVHNDYRLRGKPHTFWLFTRSNIAVKGEGPTDACALDAVRLQIRLESFSDIDADLNSMNRDALISEVVKLRAGIRRHRDRQGHDLCWYSPEIWDLLPEKMSPNPKIPEESEFLERCRLYRISLDKTNAEF